MTVDSSSEGAMKSAFTGRMTNVDCVVVTGDCVTFVTGTEAEVTVAVVVVEPEAAVPDAVVAGVLNRLARAASLIVADEANKFKGVAVNGLRVTEVDEEVASSSVVIAMDSEEEVVFVPPTELEVACEARIAREASAADKANARCPHGSRRILGRTIPAAAALLNVL